MSQRVDPKAAQAFRSIGEAARLIGVPTHVLRYWETQFPELSPTKRADGRRYYRPDDLALIAGIFLTLRQDGMTVRGARKAIAIDQGKGCRARGATHLAHLEGTPSPQPTSPPQPTSAPDLMPRIAMLTKRLRRWPRGRALPDGAAELRMRIAALR